MRFPLASLAILVLPALASCDMSTSATGTATGCVVLGPDAGMDASTDVICNITWSCESGSSRYGLQCAYRDGDYHCSCLTEDTVGKTFPNNPFTCDSNSAMPTANAGCGWSLTQ